MKKRLVTLSLALCLAFSLAIPAGAAGVTEEDSVDKVQINMIESIFTNKEACQVFNQQGEDITKSFLAQHQEDYDNGNFASIAEDIGENQLAAVCPAEEGISPRLVVGQTLKKKLYMTYTYGGASRTAEADAVVKCTINDSTGGFVSVQPATLANAKSGTTGATVSGNGYNVKIDGGTKRMSQHVKFSVTLNGKTVTSQWSTGAWAGDSALTATFLSQSGSL